MLGFVRQLFPYTTMYGVMADTGFEHKTPISAMDCTDSARRTWSRGPIDKFIRALPQKALISCLGIRQKNRARAQSSHLGK
jgi:hypothetical protein